MESRSPSPDPLELFFGFLGEKKSPELPKKGAAEYRDLLSFVNWLADAMKSLELECVLEGWSYYDGKKVVVASTEHSFDFRGNVKTMQEYGISSDMIHKLRIWMFTQKWKGYCLLDAETFHLVKSEILIEGGMMDGVPTKTYQFIYAEIK